MGVEWELYNPARDEIFDLDKASWVASEGGRRAWVLPASNTLELWSAAIAHAWDLPGSGRRCPPGLAEALVAFCEPDISACWVTPDCYMTVAEHLGRWPAPPTTRSVYGRPPEFLSEYAVFTLTQSQK